MKKVISIVISLIFVLSASGCTAKKQRNTENKKATITENESVKTEKPAEAPVNEQKTETPAKNETAVKSDFPFTGQWQVVKAEYEKTADPMKKAFSTLLKNRIKDGTVINISDDLTGSVDGESVKYKWEMGLFTIIFDDSKNFNFELSFDDGKLEMEIDDVAEFELIKK